MNGDLAPLAALVCSAGFGLVAPSMARASRPAAATWLLTAGAVASALSAVTVLTMVALPLVGRDDTFDDAMHLSSPVLAKDSGTGVGVAAVALGLLLVVVARTLARAVGHRRDVDAARRFSTSVSAVAGLVVLPVDAVDACALPGRPGVVVTTRGLMRMLSAQERRAVLTHERAHLRHRHHRHLALVALAASLNPLLRGIPGASAYAVERWADEEAARATSRATTARTLSYVATAADRAVTLRAALAAAATAVLARIEALRGDAPRLHPLRLALPLLLSTAALLAAVVATGHTYDVFRLAAETTHRVLRRH